MKKMKNSLKFACQNTALFFAGLGLFLLGGTHCDTFTFPTTQEPYTSGQLARTSPGAVNDASNPIASQDPTYEIIGCPGQPNLKTNKPCGKGCSTNLTVKYKFFGSTRSTNLGDICDGSTFRENWNSAGPVTRSEVVDE